MAIAQSIFYPHNGFRQNNHAVDWNGNVNGNVGSNPIKLGSIYSTGCPFQLLPASSSSSSLSLSSSSGPSLMVLPFTGKEVHLKRPCH